MTRAIKAHLGDFIALLALFVVAIGVTGYIVLNQDARPNLPFIDQAPFTLNAEFSTAQAVTPGQGQSVRVAGVQIGKITGVTLKNGVAVVTMEIEPKWNKTLHLRSDATALLRPRTGLKDMFIELDPGGQGQVLKTGATIPVANTAPDINPDEILSALDGDTRQYLELLINGAGQGLQNHGTDLNQTFKALEPTNYDLRRITSAIAQRRTDLKALIHNYGDLTNTLADKDHEIQTLVNSADAVFRTLSSQNQNIASAVSKLPATLRQTQSTLTKANAYARLLAPTLNSLDPAFTQLTKTNQQILPFVREAYPQVKNQIRPFIQTARPYVRNLKPAAVNLSQATPDLTTSFHELNRFFNTLAYNPQGSVPVTGNAAQDSKRDQGYLFWAAWLGANSTSLFSTSDSQGPLRRFYLQLDCRTIQQVVSATPAAGPLLGLTNALNDPGLCPAAGNGSTGLPGLPTVPGLTGPGGLIPLKQGTKAKSAPRGGQVAAKARRSPRAAVGSVRKGHG